MNIILIANKQIYYISKFYVGTSHFVAEDEMNLFHFFVIDSSQDDDIFVYDKESDLKFLVEKAKDKVAYIVDISSPSLLVTKVFYLYADYSFISYSDPEDDGVNCNIQEDQELKKISINKQEKVNIFGNKKMNLDLD